MRHTGWVAIGILGASLIGYGLGSPPSAGSAAQAEPSIKVSFQIVGVPQGRRPSVSLDQVVPQGGYVRKRSLKANLHRQPGHAQNVFTGSVRAPAHLALEAAPITTGSGVRYVPVHRFQPIAMTGGRLVFHYRKEDLVTVSRDSPGPEYASVFGQIMGKVSFKSRWVPQGRTIRIRATPAPGGWTFAGWGIFPIGGVVNSTVSTRQNPLVITVTRPIDLNANFQWTSPKRPLGPQSFLSKWMDGLERLLGGRRAPQADTRALQAVSTLYRDLEDGHYREMARMIRQMNGQPFSAALQNAMIQSLRHTYGPSGAKIHVSRLVVQGKHKLPAFLLQRLHAAKGYEFTLAVKGTSQTACLSLPFKNMAIRVIEQSHRWYIAQEMQGEYLNMGMGCSGAAPPSHAH